MQPVVDPSSVRVTTQYWKGESRICELECRGQSLDIHVIRSQVSGWILEAHSNRNADAIVLAGSGATCSLALTDLASVWKVKAPLLGLFSFDWTAVAEALRAVRIVE